MTLPAEAEVMPYAAPCIILPTPPLHVFSATRAGVTISPAPKSSRPVNIQRAQLRDIFATITPPSIATLFAITDFSATTLFPSLHSPLLSTMPPHDTPRRIFKAWSSQLIAATSRYAFTYSPAAELHTFYFRRSQSRRDDAVRYAHAHGLCRASARPGERTMIKIIAIITPKMKIFLILPFSQFLTQDRVLFFN